MESAPWSSGDSAGRDGNRLQAVEPVAPGSDLMLHAIQLAMSISSAADERIFWAVLLNDIGMKFRAETGNSTQQRSQYARRAALAVPVIMKRVGASRITHDVAWLVRLQFVGFKLLKLDKAKETTRQTAFSREPLFPLLLDVARVYLPKR